MDDNRPRYEKLSKLKLASLVSFKLTGKGKMPDVSRIDPDALDYIHQELMRWQRHYDAFVTTAAEHDAAAQRLRTKLAAGPPVDQSQVERETKTFEQKTGQADRAGFKAAGFGAGALLFAAGDAAITAYAIRDFVFFGAGLLGLMLTWAFAAFIGALVGRCFEIGYYDVLWGEEDTHEEAR